ncbi:hypothetical protein [Caudoviricetes sp.]|nr:hypothetical protein [Caudoviricetes sp.]
MMDLDNEVEKRLRDFAYWTEKYNDDHAKTLHLLRLLHAEYRELLRKNHGEIMGEIMKGIESGTERICEIIEQSVKQKD